MKTKEILTCLNCGQIWYLGQVQILSIHPEYYIWKCYGCECETEEYFKA